MLSVEEALNVVRHCVAPLAPKSTPLAQLLGLRLANDVTSGVDSPPFDKSVVDGFALAADDPSPTLQIVGMITAGEVPDRPVTPGTTIRVMTGAPVPAGTAAVVKWEDCASIGEDAIRNPAAGVPAGACILKRGAAFSRGQVVLQSGKSLGPLDIALLAEIGQAEVAAVPRPRVGVLPTGDELVQPGQPCGPGQIRNSNGPMLLAALAAAGADAVDLGIGRDVAADLRERIARGLECDVLLVSGGVSAGVKDLVPGVLADLGVVEQFHQVRMKPGKPLWFGTLEPGDRRRATGVSPVPGATGVPPVCGGVDSPLRVRTGDTPVAPVDTPVARTPTLVFGLPGNPVSTFVAYRLFVLPALKALAGGKFAPVAGGQAVLAAPVRHRGGRPTYQPCRVVAAASGEIQIESLDWKGSADLATLTRATCLAVLPPGDYTLEAGAQVEVLPL